jgi:hypothetical protein
LNAIESRDDNVIVLAKSTQFIKYLLLYIDSANTSYAVTYNNMITATNFTETIYGLTATNIYTKAETDNLLAPKATTAYVVAQLLLQTNQATTYTNTETDNLLNPNATTSYVDAQLILQSNQSTTCTNIGSN